MSRRPLFAAVPLVTIGVLALTGCGDQPPGGAAGRTTEAAVAQSTTAAVPTTDGPEAPVVMEFEGGEFPSITAIHDKYVETREGPLGLHSPTGQAREIDGSGDEDRGVSQEFLTGTVFWSPEAGAHIVRGQILETYLETGGPTGRLGWPVGDETEMGGVVWSEFRNGTITLEDGTIRVERHRE